MATLGAYLRDARERRGISLDDIARVTRIRRPHLEALEADRYGDLPAAPFLRGFLAAYAKQVGLEVDDVLARYQAATAEARASEPPAPPARPSPPPAGAARAAGGAASGPGAPPTSRSVLVLLGLVGVGALAVVGSMLARPSVPPVRPSASTPIPIAPPEPAEPAGEPAVAGGVAPAVDSAATPEVVPAAGPAPALEPAPAAEPTGEAAPAPPVPPAVPAPATETPERRPVPARAEATSPASPAVAAVPERRSTLAFTAVEDTWVQVRIDGGTPVEASLRPGDRVSWQGGRFDVIVGNAGGVTVEFDGAALAPLGESGRRVVLTLPRPQAP